MSPRQRKDAKLFDINDGRFLGYTSNMSRTFLSQILGMQRAQKEFAVIRGRSTRADTRELVDSLNHMGVECVLWQELRPDMFLIADTTDDTVEGLREMGLALAALLLAG